MAVVRFYSFPRLRWFVRWGWCAAVADEVIREHILTQDAAQSLILTQEAARSTDPVPITDSEKEVQSPHPQDAVQSTHPQDEAQSTHSQDEVQSTHPQDEAQSTHSQDEVQSSHPQDVVLPLPAALIMREDGITTRTAFTSASELSDHLLTEKCSNAPKNRLYTLQSLPLDYVQVFGVHFDIDAVLIDSHANRNCHQLIGRARHNAARRVRVFALDHVELWGKVPPVAIPLNIDQDLMPHATPFYYRVGSVRNNWLALPCHVTLITEQDGDGAETCEFAE